MESSEAIFVRDNPLNSAWGRCHGYLGVIVQGIVTATHHLIHGTAMVGTGRNEKLNI